MREDRTRGKIGRIAAAFLLLVLGFGLAMPVLLRPRPALAFPVEDVVTETQTTVVNVFNNIKDNLVEGAVSALVNGANYFLSKMAYELAVSLTSDCPGQTICWDSSNLADGLEDAWQGAVGEAVGTLSEVGGFSEIGFNLCDPSNPLTSLRIQVGLLDGAGAGPAEPRCSFQSIRDNWSSLSDELTSDEALDAFMPQFQPGQSGLSVALGVFGQTQRMESDALAEATLQRITNAAAGGGFSDIVDPVSGRVLSPSSVVKSGFERMEAEKEEAPREGQERTNAGQIAKGAVLSVVVNTVQTFVQTFVSRLWNKFTSGLLSAEEAITAQPDIILSEEGLFRPPGRSTSRQVLTRLLTPPSREIGAVDPLLNFTVCPTTNRQPDNCVMDAQFANSVRIAGATPMTVAQAIEEGYLHAEWPLVPAGDPRDQDPFCYSTGYCESNLKKLRAARVIPIGWEIAAHQAYGAYANLTLGDAVAGFYDCNETGERDSRHPFCKLINPEWVLKAPPAQCRAESYGPALVSSQIPQRIEECVDYRTCLKQDDFGNCIGGWGYCLRERNAWRFNGDQCPAHFNTCRMLNPTAGGTPVSYLMNTVDYGVCNADNVGCQDYATTLNAVSCQLDDPCSPEEGESTCEVSCSLEEGEIVCGVEDVFSCRAFSACQDDDCEIGCEVADGQLACTSSKGLPADDADDWMVSPARYFNAQIESCDARDVGCSSLVRLGPGQSLNLLNNPSFEQRADVDRNGVLDRPVGWLLPSGRVPEGITGYVTSDFEGTPDGGNAVLLTRRGGDAEICPLGLVCETPGGCVCEDGGYSCLVSPGQDDCVYGSRLVHDLVTIRPGQLYAVSGAFAAADEGEPASGRIELTFFDQSGERMPPGRVSALSSFSSYIRDYDASLGFDDPCGLSGDQLVMDFVSPIGSLTRLRASCSFYISNPEAVQVSVEYAASENRLAGDVYVDAVQFEQGPLTPFHQGYSSSQTMPVKLAPAYLECTGEPNDRPECDSFARVCRQNEVGCDSYTPVNGDPSVPGIISDQDYCPAECVGYDMFLQEETDFEVRAAEEDYFIPSTARQCSAVDVGCTAFTNLENENIEFFSRLRICSAPDDRDVETFYTWEGSDTTGFQLRSWALKRTTAVAPEGITVDGEDGIDTEFKMTDLCLDGECGQAPCVRLDPANPNRCIDNPADPEERDGFCSQEMISRGDYDCREFYDRDGSRHYRRLSSTIVATADCSRYRLSGRSQEDCEKWNGDYDEARGECIYRASASWSRTCRADAAGCRSYRGNAATNVQTVFVEDFESEITSHWGVGRAVGFEQSSESVIVGGHSAHLEGGSMTRSAAGQFSSGSLFSVSFWARGNGSIMASMVQAAAGICEFEIDDEVTECEAADGCFCRDEFGHTCTVLNGETACNVEPIEIAELAVSAPESITNDWRRYEIGPVALGEFALEPGSGEALRLTVLDGDGGTDVYLDNVVLTRVRDNTNVIRDSWSTPGSCDRTIDGVYSPLEMLGCREYTNSRRGSVYLRSITNLCRDVAVGCSAYSNTQNTSDTTATRTYGAVCRLDDICRESPNCSCDYEAVNPVDRARPQILTDVCRVPAGETECRFDFDGLDVTGGVEAYPDRFTLPADERVYLVVENDDACSANSVGCRNLGLPELQYERQCKLLDDEGEDLDCDREDGCACEVGGEEICTVSNGASSCYGALDNGTVAKWKAVAVKDDPTRYDQTLCREEAVGCQAYQATDGAYFMKDPGNQICEFKTNVQYEGRVTSGWFRKSSSGSIFPCYEDLLVDGATYGIYRNRDADLYTGWVGSCPAEYDRCEEFLDPNDLTVTGSAQAYYYIDNNKLDRSACDGQVSLSRGCILLNQTSKANVTFSTAASYFRSERESGGGPTTPVSCAPGSDNDYCQNRCQQQVGYCGGTDIECRDDGPCGPGSTCNLYTHWGSACLTDNDCDLGRGETCEDVTDDPAYGNDTNTVLRVRQDRECAEWLECDQYSLPVYDSVKGRWSARCAGVSTCEDNMRIGDSYVCTDFKDVPREVLTVDDYASRDTSWRGLEYSGYSIIDRYPPQFLRAYKITTGQCIESTDDGDVEVRRADDSIVRCRDVESCREACDSDEADCLAAETYCSAPLTGICVDGDYTGQSCSTDEHCTSAARAGYCSLSEFDTTRFGIKLNFCRKGDFYGAACRQDEDCFEEPEREARDTLAGACALSCTQDTVTGDGTDGCPSDGHGSSCVGPDCPPDYGSCIESSCVYDYRGGPLRSDDWANAPSCRAYPEADAPFPQDVLDTEGEQVKSLRESGATAGYDANGNPVQKQTQYRGANVCYEGNSCECSYARVSYGSGSGLTRYQSPDRSIKYRTAPGLGQVGDFVTGSPAPGVCLSGPYDGRSCTPGVEGQCGPLNEGGSCVAISSYTLALGWPGFCVDRDRSQSLYGSEDKLGCNLWLPLDMIPGMSDAYSFSPEAGFESPVGNLMYCAEARGYGEPGRGVCSNNLRDTCVNDIDCGEENTCLQYTKLVHNEEDYGVPLDHEYDKDSAEDRNHWFHFDDTEGIEDRRDTCDEGRRNDCNTYAYTHLPISWSLDRLAGIGVKFNRGMITMSDSNDWGFALHWSGEDDHMRSSDLETYDVGGTTYIKNQTTNSEPDCLDWLKEGRPNDSPCHTGYSRGEQHCIAAWAHDDGFGQTEIETVICTTDPIKFKHWVPVEAAWFYVREECTTLDQVNNQTSYPPNVAWTDRLYDLRSGRQVTVDNLGEDRVGILFGLQSHYWVGPSLPGLEDMGVDHSPLGAVAPQFSPLTDSLERPIPVVGFPGPEAAGSPYTLVLQDDENETVNFQEPDPVFGRDIAAGLPMSCRSDCEVSESLEDSTPMGGVGGGLERIGSLFAKVFGYFIWNEESSSYGLPRVLSPIQEEFKDYRVKVVAEHQPPLVVPADTRSDNCTDDGRSCPELTEQPGLAVDGHLRDICYEGGYATNVELAFYAYVDSNHLPIRRYVIDYGDGSEALRLDGAFKNRRGLDGSGQPICNSDPTDWGLNPDACDSSYLSFKKTFVCTEATAASLRRCSDFPRSPDDNYPNGNHYPCVDDSGCCLFKPRVQVLDNWGVCNGVCPNHVLGDVPEYAGREDGDRCFNSALDNYLAESITGVTPENNQNECEIMSAADRTYSWDTHPYTPYQGVLKVCPGGCP